MSGAFTSVLSHERAKSGQVKIPDKPARDTVLNCITCASFPGKRGERAAQTRYRSDEAFVVVASHFSSASIMPSIGR